jgi:uncharacterized protein (TIGR02145 family)
MKSINTLLPALLWVVFSFFACTPQGSAPLGDETLARDEAPAGAASPESSRTDSPHTSIPDAWVGTWYADHNQGPLTVNWDRGTFQGEQGFREFRTMVLTQDGQEAVEYYSEVFNSGDEVKQYLYKLTGTLEYQKNPASLTFHAHSGTLRVFSNKTPGYRESPIRDQDLKAYQSVLFDPEATTFSHSPNYLTAKRKDGGNHYSVRYVKVGSTPASEAGAPNPDAPYANPPASGTYVAIGNGYYPTVTIGDQEWTSVNYAGTGGITDTDHPHYGTFFKYADLKTIPLPDGWRIPTRQDYLALLESQGIAYDTTWGSTDGDDLPSKKRLGQLMAVAGWLKEDGYANNQSGFNAVPANIRVLNGNPHGEGTNCVLWTSDLDKEEIPLAFTIIQLPSDTYASIRTYPPGYNPPHLPVRFVRDK